MAEEDLGEEGLDEAGELERLLEEGGEAEQKSKFSPKAILGKIRSSKIGMIIAGVVLLLLIGGGVGLYFFLTADEVVEEIPLEGIQPEEEVVEEEVEKVYIYKLEPFFLPLTERGKETGRFISVQPNLMLSNATLDKEIDKVLPLVRKNIYKILRRKKPQDFSREKAKIKERIKKEILTASNALLLSGTGTITDVFFTEFIIK